MAYSAVKFWFVLLVICSCLALSAQGQMVKTNSNPHSTNWLRFYHRFPTPQHVVVTKSVSNSSHSRYNLEAFTLNTSLFKMINQHRCAFMDYLCIAVLFIGSGWIAVVTIAITAIVRRRVLPVLLIAIAVETLAVVLLKGWLDQPRPAGMLGDVYLVEWLVSGSLPSGDTAMAFVIAWVLQRDAKPAWRAILLLCAALVAYERVYFGAHFPLDVVTGAGIGIAAAILAEYIHAKARTMIKRRREKITQTASPTPPTSASYE